MIQSSAVITLSKKHNTAYITVVTEAEYKSDFDSQKTACSSPVSEDFGENWPRYNATALYLEYWQVSPGSSKKFIRFRCP